MTEKAKLKGVIRGERKPPRVVIYGPPGVGKTTVGAQTPNPIFVPTEDGASNLSVDQFPVAATWQEFGQHIKSVAKDEHEYQTLVIDTLNGAADLAAEFVCARDFKGDWGDKGFASFAKGWAATSDEMRRILPMLSACRDRGMTVLMLAHEGILNVKNPVDGEYVQFAPALDKRVWARFARESDLILRADYDYVVVNEKGQSKGKAVGTTQRLLHCHGTAAEVAKTRAGWSLPERLPLEWSEVEWWLDLWNVWDTLPADRQAKAIKWLGVERLQDAPREKLTELLAKIKEA